jgi:hypothetical protein
MRDGDDELSFRLRRRSNTLDSPRSMLEEHEKRGELVNSFAGQHAVERQLAQLNDATVALLLTATGVSC